VLKVIVDAPSAEFGAGQAQVKVTNPPAGDYELSDTWLGGVQFFNELDVTSITPKYVSAAGGTRIRIEGDGFLPGNSLTPGVEVDVNGIPLLDVVYVSPELLTGVVPAGYYGPVDLTVTNRSIQQAGYDRIIVEDGVQYGLRQISSERFANTAQKYIVSDQNQFGKFIYTSAGLFNDGNYIQYPISGMPLLSSIYSSYYALGFDVSNPLNPEPARAKNSAFSTDEMYQYIYEPRAGELQFSDSGRAPDSRALTITEFTDSNDESHALLLVANGNVGLTVLDLLETYDGSSDNEELRVLASDFGLANDLAADVAAVDSLAVVAVSGRIDFYDLSDPTDPVRIDSIAGSGNRVLVNEGVLFRTLTSVWQPDYYDSERIEIPATPSTPPDAPKYPTPRFSGTFGAFAGSSPEEYGNPSSIIGGSLELIDLKDVHSAPLAELEFTLGQPVDLAISGNIMAVAVQYDGIHLFDISEPSRLVGLGDIPELPDTNNPLAPLQITYPEAAPAYLAHIAIPDASNVDTGGRYSRVELHGAYLYLAAK
jgi:hypothetical protein